MDENISNVNLERNISFKDSKRMIAFEMENYDVLYAKRNIFFNNTNENDRFYLIFVESDKKKPVCFYNTKYVKLSFELLSKTKL